MAMLRKREEERSDKLQVVFSKLSTVLPKTHHEIGTRKTMSSEVIETVLGDIPIPPPAVCPSDVTTVPCSPAEDKSLCLSIPILTLRLETELRSAKRTHLSCGEVLLPCDLLHRISCDIFSMAESEPYGIRGCLIYLNFEGTEECRKLGKIKCDPATATTFELNLTFKQTATGWNFLPQFIKNIARGGTIVVSPAYTLSKKKLYRSILE